MLTCDTPPPPCCVFLAQKQKLDDGKASLCKELSCLVLDGHTALTDRRGRNAEQAFGRALALLETNTPDVIIKKQWQHHFLSLHHLLKHCLICGDVSPSPSGPRTVLSGCDAVIVRTCLSANADRPAGGNASTYDVHTQPNILYKHTSSQSLEVVFGAVNQNTCINYTFQLEERGRGRSYGQKLAVTKSGSLSSLCILFNLICQTIICSHPLRWCSQPLQWPHQSNPQAAVSRLQLLHFRSDLWFSSFFEFWSF